ncbi:MAG TPA: sigma 54-interacting transcriptional regulator [Terriglobales bacterium]|nr:sigma 54-interacting transcriptional regulator [Terriglobales bacterium]
MQPKPGFDAESLIPFAYAGALSEPEKLLAAYFKSSAVGLGILDAQFRYLALNHTLAEINGLPAGEHLGKKVRDVLGPVADKIEPVLQGVVATGDPVLNLEVSAQLPTRSEVGHWIVHHLPIKGDDEKVERIGVVVTEITEQKKLEKSLHDLTGRLHKEMARLEMLLEVSSILSANWNVQQVFPSISARVRRVLRQEYAGFSLQDSASGLLVRQAEDFPLGKGFASSVVTSDANSPAGKALAGGAPIIFSKEQLQGFDAAFARKILDEGLQSLCCVPLLRPKGPLGVLIFGSTRKAAFQSEDLSLLNQVAAQLAVAIENHRAAAEIEELKQKLTGDKKYLEGEVRTDVRFAEIIGDSPALRQVLAKVSTVATSDATVLILGETGTGKELIARAIHDLSRRVGGSFIKVNCAAIPTGLLESELFGHERGAFTGAVSQKVGRMELANGGTLFLDEVGEIPLELQPKLLRALQDQEFERLGSTRTIRVNVRLVAATNRDLARSVTERDFRADLFYRINVFPILVPPLRERREDILLLIRYFVRKFCHRMGRNIENIPKETMEALTAWAWPGNVRELENLMERSVILSEGTALRVPLSELQAVPAPAASLTDHSLENAEREHILRVLRETGGVLSGPGGAAHRLGLKRTTLQSKMERLKIKRRDYTPPPRS